MHTSSGFPRDEYARWRPTLAGTSCIFSTFGMQKLYNGEEHAQAAKNWCGFRALVPRGAFSYQGSAQSGLNQPGLGSAVVNQSGFAGAASATFLATYPSAFNASNAFTAFNSADLACSADLAASVHFRCPEFVAKSTKSANINYNTTPSANSGAAHNALPTYNNNNNSFGVYRSFTELLYLNRLNLGPKVQTQQEQTRVRYLISSAYQAIAQNDAYNKRLRARASEGE